MKLEQLQRAFQAHLLHADEAIAAQIAGDALAPVAQRLGVYTGAYVARLTEVLAETFPALRTVLGERQFARHVADFVRECPSRFRSARDYGEALPPWLAAHASGPRSRTLADLGRFEWAMAAAFDAADAATVGPQHLAGLDPSSWPALQLRFAPGLECVDVASNAVAWWKHACAGGPRPSRLRHTCTQHWLIWRQDLGVFYRRLAQAEHGALSAARAGQSFGQWCEALSDPSVAAGLLHGWLTAGLVTEAQATAAVIAR